MRWFSWMCVLLASVCLFGTYNATVTNVHIVTMNHLDVGFAQLAYNIINLYFDVYFPNAAITAQALRNNGTERLIYTCHAWLIDIYVNCEKYAAINALPPGPIHCPNSTALQLVTTAINQGDITWHAFPFNAEIEFLMNPDFLAATINTVHYLDAQFNFPPKATVSQRDVPGVTRSAIPIFVQQGVQALSVGVNGASSPPAVPKIFLWEDPVSSTNIIAMWHPGGYGGDTLVDCVTFENFEHALCWDFRGDNQGPPAIPEVLQTYQTVRNEFPGANVFASTYDNFVNYVIPIKSQLPVITGEIGDTWIHGVASDPLKTAYTREIIRARSECVASKECDTTTFNFHAFDLMMVKNAEHTWGVDVKTWLKDTINWNNDEFNKVKNQPNYQTMVNSWVEQRAYIGQAISALGKSNFAIDINNRINALSSPIINLSGFTRVDPTLTYPCGRFQLAFNETTGAINYLLDKNTKYNWATKTNPIAEFLYMTYSQDDYTNFLGEYMNIQPPPSWAWNDFGKPNMTNAHVEYLPTLEDMYLKESEEEGYQFYLTLNLNTVAMTENGGPKVVYTYIYIPSNGSFIDINVIWENKTSTRLAESVFVSFVPAYTSETNYAFNKLGEWITVDDVLLNGSNHIHAVQQGVRYMNGARSLTVSSLDAALVCIGAPTSFPTPLVTLPDPSLGSHFILYDNIWGTNYIMWYPFLDEDWRQVFRFQLNIE